MKNEKLKIASDAMWLAINAFQVLQNEADENKGYLGNDTQYEIAGILEATEKLLDNELNILHDLNHDGEAIDKDLANRFKELFGDIF